MGRVTRVKAEVSKAEVPQDELGRNRLNISGGGEALAGPAVSRDNMFRARNNAFGIMVSRVSVRYCEALVAVKKI